MKEVPRKFGEDYEMPEITLNPFIEKLQPYASRGGREKVKPSELVEFLQNGSPEIFAEPELILDFDGGLFPDHLELYIYFTKNIPDNFEILYVLKRTENEMLGHIIMTLEGRDYYTYPLNLANIQMQMNNCCEEYGLIPSDWIPHNDSYSMPFYFIFPVNGNMLQAFNQAWSKLEMLYHQACNRIIKDIKES